MKQKNAFTMIEILVVLVILGVLIAIAVPSFEKTIKHAQVQDAKNNLLSIYAGQQNHFALQSNFYALPGCTVAAPVADLNLAAALRITFAINNDVTYCCGSATAISGTNTSDDFFCMAQGVGFGLKITNTQVVVPMNTTPYPLCTAGTANPCCESGICR